MLNLVIKCHRRRNALCAAVAWQGMGSLGDESAESGLLIIILENFPLLALFSSLYLGQSLLYYSETETEFIPGIVHA